MHHVKYDFTKTMANLTGIGDRLQISYVYWIVVLIGLQSQ